MLIICANLAELLTIRTEQIACFSVHVRDSEEKMLVFGFNTFSVRALTRRWLCVVSYSVIRLCDMCLFVFRDNLALPLLLGFV